MFNFVFILSISDLKNVSKVIEAIYAERKTINNAFRIFVTVRMFVSDERDLLLEKIE